MRERERGRERAREAAFERADRENRWAGRALKQQERRGLRHGSGKDYLRNSLTLFFSNFPKDHGVLEMWKIFQKWGKVVDVFIPPRKDKSGSRFGFVRFSEPGNWLELEKKLDGMWIGNYKLKVNKPRFNREDKGRIAVNKVMVKDAKSTEVDEGARKQRSEQFRRSWRPVLKESILKHNSPSVAFEYATNGEHVEWLRKSFVGNLINFEDVENIQKVLHGGGFYTVKAIPMGGRKVLLCPDEDKDIGPIILGEKEWFMERFENIEEWRVATVASERLVWVQCVGVPPIAWEENFFRSISCKLGSFVKVDEVTTNRSRLDFARMLVSTSSKMSINCVLDVKINDEFFKINVIEEPAGPSCTCSWEHNPLVEKKSACINDDSQSVSDSEDKWKELHQVGFEEEEEDGDDVELSNVNLQRLCDRINYGLEEGEILNVENMGLCDDGGDKKIEEQARDMYFENSQDRFGLDAHASLINLGSNVVVEGANNNLGWAQDIASGCRQTQLEINRVREDWAKGSRFSPLALCHDGFENQNSKEKVGDSENRNANSVGDNCVELVPQSTEDNESTGEGAEGMMVSSRHGQQSVEADMLGSEKTTIVDEVAPETGVEATRRRRRKSQRKRGFFVFRRKKRTNGQNSRSRKRSRNEEVIPDPDPEMQTTAKIRGKLNWEERRLEVVLNLKNPIDDARALWKLGKELGVLSVEGDDAVVRRLTEMEMKDMGIEIPYEVGGLEEVSGFQQACQRCEGVELESS